MTYTRFLIRNLARSKLRNCFLFITISFAAAVIAIFGAVYRGFFSGTGLVESSQRVIVRHRASLVFTIPEWYRHRIRELPGVSNVVPMTWLGGRYKDDSPEHFFAQFATDAAEIFQVYRDWEIDPKHLDSWMLDRRGAVVETRLAERLGWRIGDVVRLERNIYPVDIEVIIRGFFSARATWQALLFHQDLLFESLPELRGQVGTYVVRLNSDAASGTLAQRIDFEFRNTAAPTRTESEKAFMTGFVSMLGNVRLFLFAIGGATAFVLLCIASSVIGVSLRERVHELAVLRILGFSRLNVLSCILAEVSVTLTLGAMTGGAIAAVTLERVRAVSTAPLFADIVVSPTVALGTWLAMIIIGLLATMPGALGAVTGSPAHMLRRVE